MQAYMKSQRLIEYHVSSQLSHGIEKENENERESILRQMW